MLHHWKPNCALFRRDWIPKVRRKWYANLEQATHWAWNEVPASLSANPPGSDPVVFVNRSMKLICMICSWRCFFGCKGKEGRFFLPQEYLTVTNMTNTKIKTYRFWLWTQYKSSCLSPAGRLAGSPPREAQRLQAVAMTSYLVREPRAAGTVPKVVLVVRPCCKHVKTIQCLRVSMFHPDESEDDFPDVSCGLKLPNVRPSPSMDDFLIWGTINFRQLLAF